MIKCDGFGKLLKQGFFTLLISCFILLGGSFVSAVSYDSSFQFIGDVGLDSYNSSINGNFTYSMLKGGGLLSSYIGISKAVLALDKSRIFWWSPNGYPYAYLKSNVGAGDVEGFFDRYYVCELMTGTDLNNCTPNMIDYSGSTSEFDKQVFVSFFNTVKQGEKFYISNQDHRYIGSTWDYSWNAIRVCWNSEELGNTFCFMGGRCAGGHSECNTFGSLVNSQHLKEQFQNGLDYGLLANSWIGKAPGQLGYNDSYEGGSQGSVHIGQGTITLTGDFVYGTCSYGEIIDMLNSQGFSPYMCYGGLDNFDNYDSTVSYSPIPGTGLKLSQILANAMNGPWDTPQEWFDFWNGIYNDKKDSTFLSMWSSYPAVYRTWFDLYYQYSDGNKYFDGVREYCSLIDLDIDKTTTYKGQYFKGVCDTIIDQKQYGYTFGSSGEVGLGVNRGLSGDKVKSNAVQFIQDFFNKAQDVIPTDYSDIGLGFLPIYIATFLIALIFFRFLMH